MTNQIAAALESLGFPSDKITSASIVVEPAGPVSVQLGTHLSRDEAAGLITAVKGDRSINTVVVTNGPLRVARKLVLGGVYPEDNALTAYVEDEQGVRREIESADYGDERAAMLRDVIEALGPLLGMPVEDETT